MQADRDATYQPMILINPTEYTISWDEDGHAEWLSKHTVANPENDDIQFNEDGSIGVTMQFALNILYDGLEQFSAVNTGVGIAHNVVFKWNRNTINELYNYLLEHDSTKKDFMLMNESIIFT